MGQGLGMVGQLRGDGRLCELGSGTTRIDWWRGGRGAVERGIQRLADLREALGPRANLFLRAALDQGDDGIGRTTLPHRGQIDRLVENLPEHALKRVG